MALEFVRGMFDLVENGVNKLGIMAGGDDLFWREFLLEIEFEDRIHQFVGRKGVLVELVRGELGGRGFFDHAVRDDLAVGALIQSTSERPNLGLQHVPQNGQSAVGVAVQRAIADGEFRFVRRLTPTRP